MTASCRRLHPLRLKSASVAGLKDSSIAFETVRWRWRRNFFHATEVETRKDGLRSWLESLTVMTNGQKTTRVGDYSSDQRRHYCRWGHCRILRGRRARGVRV